MSKMNEYPSVGDPQEFTQAEKAAFLGSAMCIATGPKNSATVTANIPFSDIRPTKLSDLTDDITVDTYNATSEAPISGKGVAAALGNFGGFQVAEKGQDGKPAVSGTIDPKAIYLTPSGESGTENAYDEWICTDTSVPTWEKVGVTRVNMSQYYTKTEADSAFVSSTGYVATDNNYTTEEKQQLAGLAPIKDLSDSATVFGRYSVLKVDVTGAAYFCVDISAVTDTASPAPTTIRICVHSGVSPITERSSSKFNVMMMSSKSTYGLLTVYPEIYAKQTDSNHYTLYIGLKEKSGDAAYNYTTTPCARWHVWRNTAYDTNIELNYNFYEGYADTDITSATLMQWDQMDVVDAGQVIPVADASTITDTNGTLSVAVPVPPIDNVNNGYLLTKTANGIQWNELDRTNIVRAGAGIEVYGTAGYPERVSVINPVPTPGAAHADVGKVLTVQQASDPNDPDEIVWAAPQGGLPTYDSTYAGRVLTVNQAGNGVEWTTPQGGGGNPYTKVSVTPGARYENGKTSEYYYNLFDQDVDIVNNTYSILSTPIGYEQSEYPNSENVDVFKIKLPANTEFPLAIVEFNIEHGHEHDGAVNDIKVYVGSTELTRIYDTPYNQNTVIADSDGDIRFSNASYPNGIKKAAIGDAWIMPAINDSNMIKTNTAFVTDWRNDTNVTCQVHIFGNCFSVKTSLSNSYPSGS